MFSGLLGFSAPVSLTPAPAAVSMMPAPAVIAAPETVVEYIALAPAVSYAAPECLFGRVRDQLKLTIGLLGRRHRILMEGRIPRVRVRSLAVRELPCQALCGAETTLVLTSCSRLWCCRTSSLGATRILWHSMTDCISVAYVAWGVVWAVWELYFYTVSQHQEWSLFKYCEEIETGRLKAETWERALRGVVRSVIDGTCECDLEGIILRASPQFAELIGMEQFHLVGQSLSSLCLNAECDRVSTFIQQCVRGDQLATAATIETILCGKPDGECLRLSLFVAQIPIANGALLAGVQLQGRGNETCHDDPSDTDSATPMCSGSNCIAMSCGGGSFTPNGTYDCL